MISVALVCIMLRQPGNGYKLKYSCRAYHAKLTYGMGPRCDLEVNRDACSAILLQGFAGVFGIKSTVSGEG